MGRYGQAILTIGGTIVGAYFGYPALGTVLGSLAGSLLFPTQLPTVNGPKLTDISQTASSVGASIPRGWGVFPASGLVIAQTDLREVTQSDEVGGKGGPTQTVNTTNYFQDFAIGLNGSNLYNKGKIGGVRTIWANGKAIYDRRPRRDAESDTDFQARMIASDKVQDEFTLYLGTEDQMPDPTLEAFYGVGNISAFRGLAYIVFINWQNKPEDGNRMPQSWKFECYSEGAPDLSDLTEFSNEVLYDWNRQGNPVDLRNTNRFAVNSLWLPAGYTEDIDEALRLFQAHRIVTTHVGWPSMVYLGASNLVVNGDGLGDISYVPPTALGGHTFNIQTGVTANLYYGLQHIDRYVTIPENAINGGLAYSYDAGTVIWTQFGSYLSLVEVYGFGDAPMISDTYPWDNLQAWDVGLHYVLQSSDVTIQVQRSPGPPVDPCIGVPELGELPGFCVAGGRLNRLGSWTRDDAQPYFVLQSFQSGNGSGGNGDTRYPLNPCRPITHADNSEEFWSTAYQAAKAAGKMPSGMTYVPLGNGDPLTTYPQRQEFGYYRSQNSTVIQTGTYPVAQIIRDLCEEAGMDPAADLDTTGIDDVETIGFVRTRVMTARAAIDPLRQGFQFDGYESGGKVKFVKRGGPVALTLTEDDLGVAVDGEDVPSKLTTSTSQDVDLPRSVTIHYLSPARDYEPGDQSSPNRIGTAAVNDLDLEVPVVMTDDQALRMAQILWADAWAGRWSHETTIDMQHSEIEPTDILAVPSDGFMVRMRVSALTEQLPLLRKLELVRDDDAAWISTAIASPPIYIPPPISFAGPVEAILMDLPALSDSHDDPGFYAALKPLLGGAWRGAALYRSVDGGGSFSIIGQFGNPISAAGKLLAPSLTGPTDIWDEAGFLLVDLQYGELESRTADAVQAGANAAAIGAHGHWEIVQFRDVEFISGTTYRLTGLLRGRRGTERLIGLADTGEDFVLLSSQGVIRIPLEQAQIGSIFQYRAVGTGGNLSAALTSDFEGDGEALRPFSPVDIRVAINYESGDETITWIRRNRLGQEMPSGADIAMSEATELYAVDIAAVGGAVVRSVEVTTPQYVYAQADQESDFGLAAPYTITVYQISAVLGRGPGETITTETAPSVLPVITYPTINLQIDFGGAPDGNEDVYIQITLTRLLGAVQTFTQVILGSGKDSPDDYATELLSDLTGFFGGDVTLSQSSINNVILTTQSGAWFAAQILPVYPYGLSTVLREPLSIQVPVFQQISFDLFQTIGGFVESAPDQNNAYRVGGSAVAIFSIYGLTWEKQQELNYGITRQINWAPPNAISDQKHVATGGALDALRSPTLSQYIQQASYSVVGGITVINCVINEGYSIGENWLNPTGTGSHPSGYKPAFKQSVAGVPGYPAGAKKMAQAYFTPQYSTAPIGAFAAGQTLKITLNGVDYTHTLSADEATAFNNPGGTNLDPTVVANYNGVYDALQTAIEGSGNFTVYHDLYSNGLYQNWRIERNVAATDFTIVMTVAGYDLTVTTSTFEG